MRGAIVGAAVGVVLCILYALVIALWAFVQPSAFYTGDALSWLIVLSIGFSIPSAALGAVSGWGITALVRYLKPRSALHAIAIGVAVTDAVVIFVSAAVALTQGVESLMILGLVFAVPALLYMAVGAWAAFDSYARQHA